MSSKVLPNHKQIGIQNKNATDFTDSHRFFKISFSIIGVFISASILAHKSLYPGVLPIRANQ